MTFNNFKIREVSAIESFMGELNDKITCLNSSYGFLMGDFTLLHEKAASGEDVSCDVLQLSKKFEEFFDHLSAMSEYFYQEYDRQGKPLSIRQQEIKKARLDAIDEYRAEYCDR